VAHQGLTEAKLAAGACGLALSLLLPVPAFMALRKLGKLDRTNAAAVAAH
jgi:hypothetical protein